MTELGPADIFPAALCTGISPITDTQVASETRPKGDQEGRPRFEKAPAVGELLTLPPGREGSAVGAPAGFAGAEGMGPKEIPRSPGSV